MSKKNKVCNKCNENKSLDLFYKNRNYKDGYDYYCKKCKIDYMMSLIINHPKIERKTKVCSACQKRYPVSNFFKFKYAIDGLNYNCKECATKQSAEWREKHKDYAKNYAKDYYQKNKDKKIPYSKTNNEEWKKYYNDYIKKYKSDPEKRFRIKVARLLGFYTDKYKKPERCMCCNNKSDKLKVVVTDKMLKKYLNKDIRLSYKTIITEVDFWCNSCVYANRKNKNG